MDDKTLTPSFPSPARGSAESAKNGDSQNNDRPPASLTVRPLTLRMIAQLVLIILGGTGILYFGRPVILPVVFAVVAGTALTPLIRFLSKCHVPPALGAAVVLLGFVSAVGVGIAHLGGPALAWASCSWSPPS